MRLGFIFVAAMLVVDGQKKAPQPSKQLEHFSQMSPEQRKQELSKLPPARRERVEKQLERYESLTPEQRDRMNRRLDAFQAMAPARRVAVRQEIQRLRDLPFAQRKKILMGDEERQKYSPEEYQLLRESFPRVQ